MAQPSIFNEDHEQVSFYSDPTVGLKSIIAIHSTTLGPSAGGLRIYDYFSEQDALKDVLRLSKAMSYKAAIAGIPWGGGKGIIIGDPKNKSKELLQSYAKFVNSLDGRYITTTDVGTTEFDIEILSKITPHVVGLPSHLGGCGDMGKMTAYGVARGMEASAIHVWGNNSLKNKTVAIQGVGKVGTALVKWLVKTYDANVIIADINPNAIMAVKAEFPLVKDIPYDKILSVNCDILAPCALGGIIHKNMIPQLKCKIIAGSANNQLEAYEDGLMLYDKNIVFAPDFVINAGGLIDAYVETLGYDYNEALARTTVIKQTTINLLCKAQENRTPPFVMAELEAQRILKEAKS